MAARGLRAIWLLANDMKTVKRAGETRNNRFKSPHLHSIFMAQLLTGPSLVSLALALIPSPARAGDGESDLVTLETSSITNTLGGLFEAQGSPLQPKKGPRTLTEEEPKSEKPAEWFAGELPWWQWSRITGNWGGLRDALENGGATIAGTYTLDWGGPLSGGISRRGAARGLLDINLTVDTEPLLDMPGGTFFAQYYFRHGRNGSDHVGELQAVSNMDAERLSREYELWFEQKAFDDLVRFKVGQVDANSEFDFVEAAGEFMNGSAGFSPTLLAFPTYPDPALSFNLFVYPRENIYAGLGVYGDSIRETSRHGFRDPLWMGEVGATIPLGGSFGDLRVAAGVYYDEEHLDRFDGGSQGKGNGFYALVENQIWRENPDDKDDAQGLSIFAQYGYADDRVSPFQHHFGFGVSAVGLIPSRDSDVTGLYWTMVKTSRATGSPFDANESVFEFVYKFEVTPAISLKPDLQYIANPGGVKSADDALVLTLRLDMTL